MFYVISGCGGFVEAYPLGFDRGDIPRTYIREVSDSDPTGLPLIYGADLPGWFGSRTESDAKRLAELAKLDHPGICFAVVFLPWLGRVTG